MSKEEESRGCCPPDSTPYLAADYAAKGAETSFGEGDAACEAYTSGTAATGCNVVLVCPDVWGWNGGRTRQIADFIAASAAGVYVVVPKTQVPGLEGGTSGDGLPPGFDMGTRAGDFVAHYKTHLTLSALLPRLNTLVAAVKAVGPKNVSFVGFCYGGWTVCQVAKLCHEAGLEVGSGVICHPSNHVEDKFFGGDAAALAAAFKGPMLLQPAGNDAKAQYGDEGDIFGGFKAGHADSSSVYFDDMKHGWVPRGDLGDEKVRRDVEGAMKRMGEWLLKYF